MDLTNAIVQLIQTLLLFVVIAQNAGLRARLKALEERLDPQKSRGT